MVMDKYNPDAGREGPHRLRGGMGADLVDDTAGGGHDSQARGPWKNGVRAPVIGARMSKDSPEQAAKKAGDESSGSEKSTGTARPRAKSGRSSTAFDLWLQRELQDMFADVSREPVPDELMRLIDEAKANKK